MRLLRFFRPSHQHTAFSATLLLMTTITLSRVIGYIREAYIAYAFGAGQQTDAYVAAFTLPDWLNYIVAGGTASITFISIYTRFLAEKREQDAQKTFSIIITVMTTVLVAGTILAEIFTPQFAGWMFHGFTPEQMRLCVHLTRILLPAQIFFYVGGVVSAVLLSHRLFLLAGIRSADLQRIHHRRWSCRRAPDGDRLPCLRRPRRQHRRTISDQRAWERPKSAPDTGPRST